MRTERVVDRDAAHAEVAVDFIRSWHGVDHGVGLDVPQSLVINKKESAVTRDGTTDRSAKIISHQKIRAHVIKGVRVKDIVAQKLVSSPVEIVRSAARDNVDLPAAGAAHLGRVTSGLHLELLNRIR